MTTLGSTPALIQILVAHHIWSEDLYHLRCCEQISVFRWGTGSMSNESGELERLRAENAHLIALLESHGIDWPYGPVPSNPSARPQPEPPSLSTAEKVALFRRLFRGRADVHPVRWESATSGKSGYAPACANDKFSGLPICTAKLPAGRGPRMARVTTPGHRLRCKLPPTHRSSARLRGRRTRTTSQQRHPLRHT